MEERGFCRITSRQLNLDYYSDRILVTKLTSNADDGIDPGDDFMFLGPRCEDWKAGPCWIDDTGWVHYFPDTWTTKERDDTFVKYVCQCVYDQPVSFSTKILCLQNNCIRFDDVILHTFEIGTDEEVIIDQYEKSLKKLVHIFLKHVASSTFRDAQ